MDERWHPQSFRTRPMAQMVAYRDAAELEAAAAKLAELPPLVTSWEIERLKRELAEAQRGERLVLQGGDCAEVFDDCRPELLSSKLKILLQMSLVLVHGAMKPIVRIGRLAGQYAKPRSQKTETRVDEKGNSVTLPSYFGDLVNGSLFDEETRRADPKRLLLGHHYAATTLNFVRSLSAGGFADLHHPEQWDLSFFHHADLSTELRAEYERTSEQLAQALRFMEALGETHIARLTRTDFYISHEGLNLHYEAAQTRTLPRREGYWDLSTHLPWIGDRTRQLDGAHVEFFRGVQNPIGIKLGPSSELSTVPALLERLNPEDEAGKIVLITRMGEEKVRAKLGELIETVKGSGRKVLWICDPMHGNTRKTEGGIKTRHLSAILNELDASLDMHAELGTVFGGVHFELTGEDVTECVGAGTSEADLSRNYVSRCDPRLNYRQAMEMAFAITRKLRAERA